MTVSNSLFRLLSWLHQLLIAGTMEVCRSKATHCHVCPEHSPSSNLWVRNLWNSTHWWERFILVFCYSTIFSENSSIFSLRRTCYSYKFSAGYWICFFRKKKKKKRQCTDCGKYKGVMRKVKGPEAEQQELVTTAQPPAAQPQWHRDSRAVGPGAAHGQPQGGFTPCSRPGTCYCFPEQAARGWCSQQVQQLDQGPAGVKHLRQV